VCILGEIENVDLFKVLAIALALKIYETEYKNGAFGESAVDELNIVWN
jgi:hypothetical protein